MYLGIGLMILGIILFALGRSSRNTSSVNASGGSVAIGGSNSGSITNINRASKSHEGGHAITIIATVVEVIGIAVTIWNATHLAEK